MPSDNQRNQTEASSGRNGSAEWSFQNRIADLLDDVTVAGEDDSLPPFLTASFAGPSVAPAGNANGITSEPAVVLPTAPLDKPPPSGPAVPVPLSPPPSSTTSSLLPGVALFGAEATQVPVTPENGAADKNGVDQHLAVLGATVAAVAVAKSTVADDATSSEPASEPVVAVPAPPASAGDAYRLPPATQVISIKGRADGLSIEIGKGIWLEIMVALQDRLAQSASFFRNAQVAVDVGTRPITEDELIGLVELLKANGMTLGAMRTSAERTFQSALALGLTATLESAEGVPVADAAPATSNATATGYFVYRGYLRSGHRLKRKESILVIGDVNPGAEVISEGDVLVWGRLRGVAHAGAQGNQRAIVAALDLEPTQLRIADVVTIGPDPRPGQPGKWFWRRSANKRPEVARVSNQTIVLEEWDASRPGGLVSLRRGG